MARRYKLLINEEKEFIKSQLKAIHKQSKQEFELSKNESLSFEDRRAYLQQACEKEYKIFIHIIELKSGYNIKFHEQLSDEFYWRKAGFRMTTIHNVLPKLNYIHTYFYEGGIFPSSTINNNYNELMRYIDSVINKL